MSYTKGNWYSNGIHIMIEGKTGSQGQAFIQNVPCHENSFATDQESRANAKLMAAAPDLLEALKEVIKISDRNDDAWDKAKAAIAKAVG